MFVLKPWVGDKCRRNLRAVALFAGYMAGVVAVVLILVLSKLPLIPEPMWLQKLMVTIVFCSSIVLAWVCLDSAQRIFVAVRLHKDQYKSQPSGDEAAI
jgi:hypothetical protein